MFQRTLLTAPIRVSGAYTARTSILPTYRRFHASPTVSKTATEKVADVADKVRVPPLQSKGCVQIRDHRYLA